VMQFGSIRTEQAFKFDQAGGGACMLTVAGSFDKAPKPEKHTKLGQVLDLSIGPVSIRLSIIGGINIASQTIKKPSTYCFFDFDGWSYSTETVHRTASPYWDSTFDLSVKIQQFKEPMEIFLCLHSRHQQPVTLGSLVITVADLFDTWRHNGNSACWYPVEGTEFMSETCPLLHLGFSVDPIKPAGDKYQSCSSVVSGASTYSTDSSETSELTPDFSTREGQTDLARLVVDADEEVNRSIEFLKPQRKLHDEFVSRARSPPPLITTVDQQLHRVRSRNHNALYETDDGQTTDDISQYVTDTIDHRSEPAMPYTIEKVEQYLDQPRLSITDNDEADLGRSRGAQATADKEHIYNINSVPSGIGLTRRLNTVSQSGSTQFFPDDELLVTIDTLSELDNSTRMHTKRAYCLFFWDTLKYSSNIFYVDSSDVQVSQKFSLPIDTGDWSQNNLQIGLVSASNRGLCDEDIIGIAAVDLRPHMASLKCRGKIELDAELISVDETALLGVMRLILKTRHSHSSLRSSQTMTGSLPGSSAGIVKMRTIYGHSAPTDDDAIWS